MTVGQSLMRASVVQTTTLWLPTPPTATPSLSPMTPRRRAAAGKFTFGRHVFLRCHQLDAPDLLRLHIEELVNALNRHQLGVFVVSWSGVAYHRPSYEVD
jgi:hypothetical protein